MRSVLFAACARTVAGMHSSQAAAITAHAAQPTNAVLPRPKASETSVSRGSYIAGAVRRAQIISTTISRMNCSPSSKSEARSRQVSTVERANILKVAPR